MTINVTNIGAVLRQVLAYLGIIFGILIQSVPSLHLPVAVSTAILTVSGILVSVQHYVANPTTGTGAMPVPPTTGSTGTVG